MKCRLLREERCQPSEQFPGAWKCRACGAAGSGPLIKKCPECNSPIGQRAGRQPAGTILEFDRAWLLVQMGVAVPEDDECAKAAGLTAEQMTEAQHVQEKVRRGIHPEDYEAFEAGIMDGYNPDGSFKPGPNYADHVLEENRQHGPIIVEDE